ncbi:MAG: phosphoribosyltransferase family protein [Synergistes sp.]|nr:phosphoribosyltransferase family protein [Synergistes sp.]
MKGQRTERLVRLASKFFLYPSKLFSLTELAEEFGVSKTVISDDVVVVDNAISEEGLGRMQVDRGRSGGAKFISACSPEYKYATLAKVASELSAPDRNLPGGLIYYSDILFNPDTAFALGRCMASVFEDTEADVIMTTEVKGIPIGMFTARAMGVPLAICRFRNRPGDGAAVGVHYPSANGDVKTMYLGTRQLAKGTRVLIVDDFMRGGSTAAGMLLMAKEFGAKPVGIGVFLACDEPKEKTVPKHRSLLTLSHDKKGRNHISVSDDIDKKM